MAANVTAEIVITDQKIDRKLDPAELGTGIESLGKITMHGAVKMPSFARLATEPLAGHITLTFEQPVTSWKAGDHLIIPDTRQLRENQRGDRYQAQDEKHEIASISGAQVTLKTALKFDHKGARNADDKLEFLPHVGNLSRNVVVRSENPAGTRGHMIFMSRSDVDLRYVEVREMGRTQMGVLDNTEFTDKGQVAKLGDRAGPGDLVSLDGKEIKIGASKGTPRVIAYHKPIGELVTRSDPAGRATVFDRLPKLSPGRWVSIGRLDLNSSGLLLFTDSGELANQLMHPRHEIEREYEVRVQGGLHAGAIRRLLEVVELDDGPARFRRLEAIHEKKETGTNRWYRAVLAEGRNREVRRMVEAAGGRVSRLVRVRFGPVVLPGHLAPGRWEELDAGKIAKLSGAQRQKG